MRVHLHGGFGEKGRLCVGLESDGHLLLLDAGINAGARGMRDYYPAIGPEALARAEALVVTHAHEDHVGALGWCVANGFRGRLVMTDETRAETAGTLRGYAEAAHREALNGLASTPPPFGEAMQIGALAVRAGRSGHAVGGVWLHVSDGRRAVGHCGDVVPASPVLAMDPMPPADLVILDASYGDDAVSAAERGSAVRAFVSAHPGVVLPTPLTGRSLELLGLLDTPLLFAEGMAEALAKQIAETAWLRPETAGLLERRLAQGRRWRPEDGAPDRPLLCHDGMGLSGPARPILQTAERRGWPVLLTGHLPAGSPGARMAERGTAEWRRLPTHPTLPENLAIARGSRRALGHSAEPAVLAALAAHLPALDAAARTGGVVEL